MAENDNIQHGIDDNPRNDAEKGAALGGIGGLVTGAVAGAGAGPAGAIIGAIVGGVVGAAGSGAAVAAVDRMDNDNNVTGIGDKVTYRDKDDRDYSEYESDWRSDYDQNYASTGRPYDNDYQHAYRYGHDLATHESYRDKQWNDVEDTARSDWERSNPGTWDNYKQPIRSSWERSTGIGNGVPGVQTGGHANDGSPDTRGIMEKTADTLTGDNIDDKTGKRVDGGNLDPTGNNPNRYAYADQPGIQTGGHAADGSPDTRGISEKIADTVTGDKYDDKTGKRID